MNKRSLFGALILAVGIAGCATKPPANHVVKAVGTVTKFGLQENIGTGAYELGMLRGQIEVLTVPAVYDSNTHQWYVPDVASSYEVQGRNGLFGSAGLTSTFATGSNAVNTLVGGAHYPINQPLANAANIGGVAPGTPTATATPAASPK